MARLSWTGVELEPEMTFRGGWYCGAYDTPNSVGVEPCRNAPRDLGPGSGSRDSSLSIS